MASALRTLTALAVLGLVLLAVEAAKPAAAPRGRFPGGAYDPQGCPAWCYDSYQGLGGYPAPGAYPPYQQPYPSPYPAQPGFGFNQYSANKKPASG